MGSKGHMNMRTYELCLLGLFIVLQIISQVPVVHEVKNKGEWMLRAGIDS